MEVKRDWLRRVITYTLGIFLMGTGIALSIKANIGLSPISSVNRVMTVVFPPYTQGMFAFGMNLLMFVGAFIVDPKKFTAKNFLQLIPAFFSGLFIDMNLYLFANLAPEIYYVKLAIFVMSCAILAFGIFLMIEANLILMPNDAFVSVVVGKTKREWGNIKTILDCTLLCMSACIGLAALHQIMFIREGTIINAILVGQFIRLYFRVKNRLLPATAA